MMIKLIASDLDETLLGPGSRVVEENLRAIKKCQELGIFLIARYRARLLLFKADARRTGPGGPGQPVHDLLQRRGGF